jgi:hypothetical protein
MVPPQKSEIGMNEQTNTTASPTPAAKAQQQDAAALARYREGVEELWKLKSNKPISNGEHAHAAILFAAFFDHAEKHVRIFCQNLAKDVFGRLEVVRAAQAAITRGVTIDVILQEPAEASEFKTKFVDTSMIHILNGGLVVQDLKMNFAVMDEVAVRYEPDRTACQATAVMNDPKNAKTLNEFFASLWNASTQSGIPQPA